MVTTWGHTFIARKPSNGDAADASGDVVATATMSKIQIRPCAQKSDGTRVVVGVTGEVVEEPVVAPCVAGALLHLPRIGHRRRDARAHRYARPEKSEAQLRELALKVELTMASSFVGAIVGPGVVAGAGVAAGAGVILLCEMGHTSRLSRRSLQSLSGAATTAAASDAKMR